ncbi:hypothetical protein GPOL_c16860 [Gordonia polyisoprenivorans VH2]|uniref:Uncharacterized protein n=1 Tax=Gordonia polyisoprenivorans (strain DSM 44266 / VH2) TaxID=1112204 RepID=H6MUD9_GORPV|nr:hypothetical protein GPOL_c16860 [Gordonia polyisoprenivorans VH2]
MVEVCRAAGGPESFRHKGSRGSSLALLGTSTIGVGRAGAFPHGEASTTGMGNGPRFINRWSRCEPRAASLETAGAGAGFEPLWPGCPSAHEVSRLVARGSAPRPPDEKGIGRGGPKHPSTASRHRPMV